MERVKYVYECAAPCHTATSTKGSQADTWLWIQSIGQPLRQTEGSVYVATKLQLRHVTSAIVMWFVAEQSYTTIRKHLPFPRNSTVQAAQ